MRNPRGYVCPKLEVQQDLYVSDSGAIARRASRAAIQFGRFDQRTDRRLRTRGVSAGGIDISRAHLHRGNLSAHRGVAVAMVVAHGTLGLLADDSGGLRDAWSIFAHRQPETARTPKPDTVHGVVEYRARRNHGHKSLVYPEHMGHLWGDVLALFLVAGVLAFLTPRGSGAGTNLGKPSTALQN